MSDRGRGDSKRPGPAHAKAEGSREEPIPQAADSGIRNSAPPPSGAREPLASEHPPESINRRHSQRIAVTWSVDCETEDTFLYAAITNISEMGIFVRTTDPLPVGTQLKLRFAPTSHAGSPAGEPFVLDGAVQWINEVRPLSDNPNPGMGIRFTNLTPDDRERIVETIRTIAYLRADPSTSN
jgi:type IV pilus assembly protein PilZ